MPCRQPEVGHEGQAVQIKAKRPQRQCLAMAVMRRRKGRVKVVGDRLTEDSREIGPQQRRHLPHPTAHQLDRQPQALYRVKRPRRRP